MSDFRRPTGCLVLGFGLVAAVVYIIALVDPVGSKMADDGDPFGTPPSAPEAIIRLVMSLVFVAFGIWLLRKRKDSEVGR